MDSTPAATSPVRRDPPRALAPLRFIVLACVVVGAIWANVTRPAAFSGAIDSLHAQIDRPAEASSMLLVRVDPSRNTGVARQDPDRILDRVALRIADELSEARTPLAPPAAAVEGWLDTHGMYLLPISSHPQLAARLEREEMEAAIAAIRARLSSPVHGVGGLNPRRDPLSLQPLLFQDRGAMSYVDMDGRAAATGTGDLRSRRTDSLLIGLRSDADQVRVRETVARISEADPVRIDVVGVRAQNNTRRTLLIDLLSTLALLLASGALATVAVARRSTLDAVRAAGVAVVSLACVVPFGPPLDPLTVPVWAALFATCVGICACPRGRLSKGALASLATAVAPMYALPYAPWRDMAWIWLAAIAVSAILTWCTRDAPEADPSAQLVSPAGGSAPAVSFPARARAVALCVSVLLLASLSLQEFQVAPSSSFDFGSARTGETERAVARDFFVERNVIRFESEGASTLEVLDRAPLTLQPLRALLGEVANRADSPGSFVLPGELLESRRRSLRTLNIDEKIGDLREILQSQGFRDEAFNEFLNGATELRRFPDAVAALESGLGEWIRRFVRTEDERVILTHEFELRRADPSFLPLITQVGTPRGAAISAMIEVRDFESSLTTIVVIQLWLLTFIAWASSRSMVQAMTTGMCVAGTLAAALMLATNARFDVGAALFPVLLVCGASAAAICQFHPAKGGRSWGIWLCVWQATSGVALLASGQGGWIELGLVLTFGLVVAVGFARFVSPGLTAVLSGASRASVHATPRDHHDPSTPETSHAPEPSGATTAPASPSTPDEEESSP